jgi:hypothetical protein
MDTHVNPVCGYEYADSNTYSYSIAYVGLRHAVADGHPDSAPRRGLSCLQADLHLPRAPEPAKPGLHDERLDDDTDVDGRRKRSVDGGAAVKVKT